MKEQIKKLRISIDGLAQLTKELKLSKKEIIGTNTDIIGSIMTFNGWRDINSKEIEKAVDSLYLGKAWLGKMLQELGESTPYANDSKRHTKEDIEPAQDVAKLDGFNNYEEEQLKQDYKDKNHIEKVDWLRTEIQNVIELTLPIVRYPFGNKVDYQTIIIQHLSEARFWLGFELSRVREEI